MIDILIMNSVAVPLLTSITSPVIETDNGEEKNVITLAISSALTKRAIEFLFFVLSTTSVCHTIHGIK